MAMFPYLFCWFLWLFHCLETEVSSIFRSSSSRIYCFSGSGYPRQYSTYSIQCTNSVTVSALGDGFGICENWWAQRTEMGPRYNARIQWDSAR